MSLAWEDDEDKKGSWALTHGFRLSTVEYIGTWSWIVLDPQGRIVRNGEKEFPSKEEAQTECGEALRLYAQETIDHMTSLLASLA